MREREGVSERERERGSRWLREREKKREKKERKEEEKQAERKKIKRM